MADASHPAHRYHLSALLVHNVFVLTRCFPEGWKRESFIPEKRLESYQGWSNLARLRKTPPPHNIEKLSSKSRSLGLSLILVRSEDTSLMATMLRVMSTLNPSKLNSALKNQPVTQTGQWQSYSSQTDTLWCQNTAEWWHYTRWPQSRRRNARSFTGFSRAINLLFHRLLHQKVIVIITFIKGHSI